MSTRRERAKAQRREKANAPATTVAKERNDMTTMTYVYLAGTAIAIIGIVYNLIVMHREKSQQAWSD